MKRAWKTTDPVEMEEGHVTLLNGSKFVQHSLKPTMAGYLTKKAVFEVHSPAILGEDVRAEPAGCSRVQLPGKKP